MIYINKVDEHLVHISGDELTKNVKNHIYNYFSYEHEKNKNRMRKEYGYVQKTFLYKKKESVLPIGLLFDLCYLLKANNIPYTVDEKLKDVNTKEWVSENYDNFLKDDFSGKFKPHKHQEKAIKSFLLRKKSFGEIATSAGKSFIIYVIACMLAKQGNKVLIITDTTSLVEQLRSDILEYTKNRDYWEDKVLAIHSQSPHDKNDKNAKVFISTYASMREFPSYFLKFNCLIVDEAHKAVAPSVAEIIDNCWHCDYRIGMCGKLNGTPEHKWKITCLFGHVMELINAKELINKGMATPLEIECVKLKRKNNPEFKEYQEYVEYMITDYKRMDYIVDEAIKLNKNVILLFNRKKFGKALFNTTKQRLKGNDRQVEYIDGDVSVEDRTRIKNLFQEKNNVILIASYRTISTGVNAPNLRAIMMVEPMRSVITIVQSIGRVIRKNDGKNKAYVIDYHDTYGWGQYHSKLRKDIYKEEGHHWKDKTVNLD